MTFTNTVSRKVIQEALIQTRIQKASPFQERMQLLKPLQLSGLWVHETECLRLRPHTFTEHIKYTYIINVFWDFSG